MPTPSSHLPACSRPRRDAFLADERGSSIAIVALGMVALLGMAALVIDIGYLFHVRTKLQATADAAALAAAPEVPISAFAQTVAMDYVTMNESGDSTVLSADDVELGNWDVDAAAFTPSGSPINAVRVTVRRSTHNNNPVRLWFARVLGIVDADVDAEAVALSGGPGSRFMIDDEMIDSDVPVIEDLAASLGMTPEGIISDNDGDWFIDLPPGTMLELPTGQVGDEGMFNTGHPEFPFSRESEPSYADFLNYNEDNTSWRYGLISRTALDPLLGVSRVDDPDDYPSFVTEQCEVSPVYKSEISALNPIDGTPAVNALGLRRGLLAFKIMAVGDDPDGPTGSVLPNLVIEVCDPAEIDRVSRGVGGMLRLVR